MRLLLMLAALSYSVAAFTGELCSDMEYFDQSEWMCRPLPMPNMPMEMLMLDGNAFVAGIKAEGPRGGKRIASTNMLMTNYGRSVGDHQYLNAELMATVEKWTFPHNGYPELGQVGDYKEDNQPFVDAQHPHSSPIMGLTFSDTIALGFNRSFINVFYAPRGASTDGPVPFMHRPTGMVNPMALLSHHVGQDSGHVSSTVAGMRFGYGEQRLEFSTFHGEEPATTKVDLKTSIPDSYATRLTLTFTPHWFAMASYAYIKNADQNLPQIAHYTRYSASTYNAVSLSEQWTFQNTFAYGLVRNQSDHAKFTLFSADCVGAIPVKPGETPIYPALNSFVEEFLFSSAGRSKIWGRAELLQRTPYDLEIFDDPKPAGTRWLTAYTLGYTHSLAKWNNAELEVGASLTKLVLPVSFQPAYGGNPLSENVFLQMHGMKMIDL